MAGKLPYFPFYPDDWQADERLRLCSLAARGLWIELLSIMHKCDPRGFLKQANGRPHSDAQLARLAGCTEDEVRDLLKELVTSGVLLADSRGVLYSRRMVRDECIRQVRAKAGSLGGKATGVLLKQKSKQNPSKRAANSGNGNGNGDGIGIDSSREKEGGGGEEKGSHHDPPTLPFASFDLTAEGLAQAWCFLLSRKYHGAPADSLLDTVPKFAELLRRGLDPQRILDAIKDPQRSRNEQFWEFEKRFLKPEPEDLRARIDRIAKESAPWKKSGSPIG